MPIAPVNVVAGQELGLRSFQRVTAQVLSVAGTTAILSIEGHPVVAQLTSPDQAAALLSQRTAQFIVTQLSNDMVTLKFVKSEQPQPAPAAVPSGPELAARLLEQNNMPVTINNLVLARSILKQHLPVTARLLKELSSALAQYGSMTEADADLAAAMKAAGLPVTAESLKLVARQSTPMGESISSLIAMLSQLGGKELPPELMKQIRSNMQMLNSVIVDGDGDPSQLAGQLKASVDLLGRSLENMMLKQSQDPAQVLPEKSLLTLVRLQQQLERSGQTDSARAVREFLADVQQNQFMNVKRDPVPGSGVWTEIGFMLQGAQQKAEGRSSSARLRIAHESKEGSDQINPAYTRLIIQVDLNPNETVEVDLSLVGKQIRTSMMAPDPQWCEDAQAELPTLAASMQSLGYQLKDVQIGVGTPQASNELARAGGDASNPMTVNIEV